MMHCRFVGSVIFAFAAVAAFGETKAPADKTASGRFLDDNYWSPKGVPAAGDIVNATSTGDVVLTLDGDFERDISQLNFKTTAGATLDFRGIGSTLGTPESPDGRYGQEPFHFQTANGGHFVSIERYSVADGAKKPMLEFTDPAFVLSTDADSVTTLRITNGVFNTYDPYGVVASGKSFIISASSQRTDVEFRGPASLRADALTYKANTDGDRLVFNGGSHDILGAFTVAETAGGDFYLQMLNGAKTYMKSCTVTPNISTTEGKERRIHIDVSDSQFDARYIYCGAGVSEWNLRNAKLYGADSSWSFAATDAATQYIYAVDSVVTNGGGTTAFGKWAQSGTGCVELHATNSVFRFWKELDIHNGADLEFVDSTLEMKASTTVYMRDGGKLTLRGGSLTNGIWRTGDQYGSTVLFDGGVHRPQYLSLGANTGSSSTIRLEGGADVEATTGSSVNNGNYVGSGGNGVLDIVDGTFTVGVNRFPIGFAGTGDGEINVYTNGTFVYHDRNNAWMGPEVGVNGAGRFNLLGGTARMPILTIGYSDAAAGVSSSVRVVSGTLIADTSSYDYSYVKVAAANHPSTLSLEGGEIRTGRIFGGTGESLFTADGGRLVATRLMQNSSMPYFLHDLSRAEVGAKGLTIDSNGIQIRVRQDLTNKSGTSGVLEKTGIGVMKLESASYDVAKTVVSGGTLQLANASPTLFATALAITNGATFSLEGDVTSVTLAGLTVDNGMILLDPGDVVRVTGAVDLQDLSFAFTSTPGSATDFLVADGELSEESLAALRRAYYSAALPEGKHGKFTPVYDAQSGKTTVTFEAADDAAELTETATWTGSGAWATPGNWTPSAPTAEKKAVFPQAASGTRVEIDSAAVAGALEFAADGYELTGEGTLEIAAEQGAATIDVLTGANEISAPIVFDSVAYARTAAGTELCLSGALAEGGIKKSGSGRLVMANTSMECPYGLSFIGGTTVATCLESFGTRTKGPNHVKMLGDTLEIDAADGNEIAFGQEVRLVATNMTSALIVKTETPATFSDLKLESGAIVKRGKDRLSVEVASGDFLIRGLGSVEPKSPGVYNTPTAIRFDADGTAPAKGHHGLTVAEGELYVKPHVAGETPTVEADLGPLVVGLRTYEGLSSPTLTVDHVYFNNHIGSGVKSWIGYYINEDDNVALEPTLRILNGATFYCDTLEVGTYCYNNKLSVRPTLVVENSILQASWQINLSFACGNGGNRAVVRAKDSTVIVGGSNALNVGGAVDADFDATLVETSAAGAAFTLATTATPSGFLRFRNGSEFRAKAVTLSQLTSDFKLIFDDATWNWGTGDFALVDTDTAQFQNPDHFSLEMQGKGLVVAPSANKTLTLDVPVTGAGGFVNRGAGTVKFGSGRYQFAGKLVAEAGVIDLTDAGTVTNATIGAGAGVIKGAMFKDATIALDAVGGAVPNFENCTFTGKTRVVIGGEAASAEGIAVANYIGAVTGVGTFRLKGWKGYGGTFAAADGKVRATIAEVGLQLIVR